jgi:hypothetical protein
VLAAAFGEHESMQVEAFQPSVVQVVDQPRSLFTNVLLTNDPHCVRTLFIMRRHAERLGIAHEGYEGYIAHEGY